MKQSINDLTSQDKLDFIELKRLVNMMINTAIWRPRAIEFGYSCDIDFAEMRDELLKIDGIEEE